MFWYDAVSVALQKEDAIYIGTSCQQKKNIIAWWAFTFQGWLKPIKQNMSRPSSHSDRICKCWKPGSVRIVNNSYTNTRKCNYIYIWKFNLGYSICPASNMAMLMLFCTYLCFIFRALAAEAPRDVEIWRSQEALRYDPMMRPYPKRFHRKVVDYEINLACPSWVGDGIYSSGTSL